MYWLHGELSYVHNLYHPCWYSWYCEHFGHYCWRYQFSKYVLRLRCAVIYSSIHPDPQRVGNDLHGKLDGYVRYPQNAPQQVIYTDPKETRFGGFFLACACYSLQLQTRQSFHHHVALHPVVPDRAGSTVRH